MIRLEKNPECLTDLCNHLAKTYGAFTRGEVSARGAKEVARMASTMISAVSVQCRHAAQRGEAPDLPFAK